jgi:hypothetical protein
MRDQFRRSPVIRPAMPAQSMNPDKQNNGTPAKPFTPNLSTAFRTAGKSPFPLTPRLANAGGYQTPKKATLPDNASPLPTHRNDVTTPGSTYLSANVTPRSGPRNSRRDGPVSSPENTPTGGQSGAQLVRPTFPVATPYHRTERSPVRGAIKPEPAGTTRAKNVMTDGLGIKPISRPESSSESPGGSPMFFHASDARSSVSSHEPEPQPRPFAKLPQAPGFFYADGSHDIDEQTDDSSKGIPNKRRSTDSSRPQIASKSPPVLSPKMKTSLPGDPESRLSADSSLQPSLSLEGDTLSKSSPSPPPLSADPLRLGRLSSHRKSCSVDSGAQVASPQSGARRVTPTMSSPFLPEGISTPPQHLPSLSPRIVTNGVAASPEPRDALFPLAQSPIKMDAPSPLVDEQAANARTERKVLDLEISNSSLLAINRTLERELRKQNTELRRFRRLSRSGRLSMTTSLRSTSGGGLSVVSETDDGISVLSSIQSNDELSDSSDNESSFADDGTSSPNTLADHDARHRAHDEKRFMLDLSKHQELLVDSQKLNQSLKRCLDWTEELIKEGKKALEYHVRVSDIDIGGRVLAPDELGDEISEGRGLLSPAADVPEAFDFEVTETSQ